MTLETTLVERAEPGLQGFNIDTRLTEALAISLYQKGYHFCLRYVSKWGSERPGDLTSQEVIDILNAGLALMPVQHPEEHQKLTATLGTALGQNAAKHAKKVGIHLGTNLWLNLEGARGSSQEVIAYCEAWAVEVIRGGFKPGVYVGVNSNLDKTQLFYGLRHYRHYWRSTSNRAPVSHRGYQMKQKPTITIWELHDLRIDPNITQNDRRGDAVYWMVKKSHYHPHPHKPCPPHS